MKIIPKLALFIAALLGPFVARAGFNFASVGHIEMSSNNDGDWEGSAILVDAQKGLVLTALHNLHVCADSLGVHGPLKNNVLVGKECNWRALTIRFELAHGHAKASGATVIAHGDIDIPDDQFYDDWALLKISCEDCKKIVAPSIATKLPTEGESIAVAGFPSDWSIGKKVSKHSNMRASPGIAHDKKNIQDLFTETYSKLSLDPEQLTHLQNIANRKFFQSDAQLYHDAPIIGGYSGGPVYNAAGELVGVQWGTVAIWSSQISRRPRELCLDPSHPKLAGNHMSASREIVTWLPGLLNQIHIE